MTPGEALEVLADEVTCAAVREMIDNGLWDSYLDAEWAGSSSTALRDRLLARVEAGPDPETVSEALKVHARTGRS